MSGMERFTQGRDECSAWLTRKQNGCAITTLEQNTFSLD